MSATRTWMRTLDIFSSREKTVFPGKLIRRLYLFLMRYDWHLMTDCVRIRLMEISRCWKNGYFWTNLIYTWRTVVFFSVFSPLSLAVFTLAPDPAIEYGPSLASQQIRLFCSLPKKGQTGHVCDYRSDLCFKESFSSCATHHTSFISFLVKFMIALELNLVSNV